MYDNWSEIIEIMKPVLGFNRSRTEIKMALGSCLRTLGWRTSTGSMKSDYKEGTGETIDIVLGNKKDDGGFHAALPILICSDESANDIIDKTTKVMNEIKANIAIVVGKSFDLFFSNPDSNKAIQVGQICFDFDNEGGIKFFSLLLARDFNESNLTAYFDSLFKSKLPSMKLAAIINELIADKTKPEEVLRLYLAFEGFEGEIVDKALQNVGIDIYYKNSKVSEPKPEQEQPEKPSNQPIKVGHDNTRFSLNGGSFLPKRKFVHSVVAQYIKDNPRVTFDELETRFPSELASKVRGVVRTFAQVKEWARQNGPDILTRYCTKENEILSLYDGTEIVVNSQWGTLNFPRFLALAKKIYNVTSDAPYEGIECSVSKNQTNTTGSTRAKNFKFSMAGIKIGETIVFDPTQTRVQVVSEDTVEYNGKTYRLSTFVRTYLPDNMRTPSDTYRGPDFFSYNGETLTNLRNSLKEEESSPSEESENDDINKGIHISLQSFNSFKTKK